MTWHDSKATRLLLVAVLMVAAIVISEWARKAFGLLPVLIIASAVGLLASILEGFGQRKS